MRSPSKWYRRRALFISSGAILLVLLVVTTVALAHLWSLSTERAREIRQELFQRDLRDLVGRFDADERYAIERNLPQILNERRTLQPLLLPRQYYVGLPSNANSFHPRQPPRNCFLQLMPKYKADLDKDRICSYFAENSSPGRFLYLAATLEENDLVPLKPGDSKFSADLLKITVSSNGKQATWRLAFQTPPNTTRMDRFELTAFRQVNEAQQDRDKKIEGWAYLQPQARGNQLIHLIARLDFKEFLDEKDDLTWPPTGWQSTVLNIERRNASAAGARFEDVAYENTGLSNMSLATLGTQIFNAYGEITVQQAGRADANSWIVTPPAHLLVKLRKGPFGIKISDGDLLWPAKATTHAEALPDTALVVEVSHPWRLVEKGFWQIALYLAVLLAGGCFTTWYFHVNLLDPLKDWSKYSEQLSNVRTDASVSLPHADKRNEVGNLARAINSLIDSVRRQTAAANAEREARDKESQRRQAEEVQNRVLNLKVMGHEIRSPLQALTAIHQDANDPSRRYIDRMLAALPHLLGGAAASDAIAARDLVVEEFDIALFLNQVAENAKLIEIDNVVYHGSKDCVICNVDDAAIEDSLTNILQNANRHRLSNSTITMTLLEEGGTAIIEIGNEGPNIPDEILDKIFEFGFSTVPRTSSGGQGIGLHVARAYIVRMGGSLEVRNHPEGVVFTIRLPIAA